MTNFTKEEKIACIDKSPAAVGIHDKPAWLGLFASGAMVNDPVGSKPHVGRDEISRFYDAFIAPNQIVFDVENDTVCGMTVVRDLVIRITMSTGLQVAVPTHIRYELADESGELKIEHLFAHWELLPMVLQTLGQGLKGWMTYAKLSVHMIRAQGFGGVMGFMRGFSGVGKRGKLRAEEWLTALHQGDSATARNLVAAGAELHLAEQEHCGLDTLVEQLQGVEWKKLTAAGRTVTASLTHDGRSGALYLLFNHKRHIIEARFYF